MSRNALSRNALSRTAPSAPQLSIVVPFFNEAGTIDELHRRLSAVLFLIDLEWEIVYVDDGSSDGTTEALTALLPSRDVADRSAPVRRVRRRGALARGRGRSRST